MGEWFQGGSIPPHSLTKFKSIINLNQLYMESFEKSMQLFILLPMEVVDQLANEMKVEGTKLCELVTALDEGWVDRVLKLSSNWMVDTRFINDLTHDFIGLASNDEHFLPRL